MQLNVIALVLLLNLSSINEIYSVPLLNKGVILNELIRYYEPAMYVPEEVKNFHNRRRRELKKGETPFNKPLRISFEAHGRQFNLILRKDEKIFADDVTFDSTARSVLFDTGKVYSGFLEDEEDSSVEGLVTDEGFFDGTIFSKSEIFYVEPVSRYSPSGKECRNRNYSAPAMHTIVYKSSDVKMPPSFFNNTCASQILHVSRLAKETTAGNRGGRKSRGNGGEKRRTKRMTSDVHDGKFRDSIYRRKYAIDERHRIGNGKNEVSSLPVVNNRYGLIKSNILKTYSNGVEEDRFRKRSSDGFPRFAQPGNFKEEKTTSISGNSNTINRPKIVLKKTLSGTGRDSDDGYDGFRERWRNDTSKHVIKRATVDPKKTTCMLYLQADHLFYQKYGTEEACIEVMTRHVQRVNSIYKVTDFDQDGKSDNISFMIKRIKVHTVESSKDPGYRFPGNYGVEKFLELFSEEDYDAFCLAYMFTYRDFEMGTLGLAWTGDLKNAGGVCEKNGHYRGSLKSLNTGIVTLLNYGKHVPPAVSHVTLAHEIGHNFGSPHDPESCTPGGEDGNYIMFARATSGDKKNNNKFSPCSLNSINPVLNSKARSQMGCFTEPQMAICGNGVVETGEDCDCGWEEDCRDSCCYPQRRYPPPGEQPCKLTPNSVCSPSQGPCCTSECQLKFGDKCRDDNGCRDSSYCDGRSPACPPSVNKPNKTICNDEFVCFMGECTGSICLAYGLESCQCIPGPKDSSTKACELCCKKPGDDQPCMSSFDWNESPFDVPDMFSKPGTPCNDYNGYCDVFQKCREVDPSGPLATLRKLLLSEESLASFKRWVTEHWYAVVVIIFSIVFLLVLSTKLLGKQQDVKLKSITIIHSATTETVRLPSDGDAGLTVHPPAVRNKLPINRKVREKKLHTKVAKKSKARGKVSQESKKKKESAGKPNGKIEGDSAKKTSNPVRGEDESKTEEVKNRSGSKNSSKAKEFKAKTVEEKAVKTEKDPKKKHSASDRQKASSGLPKKKKSVEEFTKAMIVDAKGRSEIVDGKTKCENDFVNVDSAKKDSAVPAGEDPIYENVDKMSEEGVCLEKEKSDGREKVSRSKRTLGETIDSDNRKKVKGSSKMAAKKQSPSKTSPSKKKRPKKEVIEYKNDDVSARVTETTDIPSEDPLGKVQNWLMHSISTGKASGENFGIMTLTLPKSKSSPVGFGNDGTKTSKPSVGPPKIVHKNDRIVQIPKVTQKRSRSAGNLRKADRKDDRVKLQVVYKPPFKFSVKLRKNRVLGTVGTKILDEKKRPNGRSVGNGYEKMQRTAILVRNANVKREKRVTRPTAGQGTGNSGGGRSGSGNSGDGGDSGGRSVPDRENDSAVSNAENPFTFPSAVAPMASLPSLNSTKQLPIYLTDQADIDSNSHAIPSDLDVLLSDGKFLFTDA